MPLSSALEWCDRNMTNNYPIVDGATCLSRSGDLLPSSFLVDFQALVPGLGERADDTGLFISRVIPDMSGVRVELSCKMRDGTSEVCGITPPIPVSTCNTDDIGSRTFRFIPAAGSWFSGKLSAYVIVGSGQDLTGTGMLSFDHDATELISLRVMSQASCSGLSSLTLRTAEGDVKVDSDFVLKLGDGLLCSTATETDEKLGQCTVVTVRQAPTRQEMELPFHSVEEAEAAIVSRLGVPIRKINGISPDETGNLDIIGGDCTEISAGGSWIKISNPCSKPCCGDLGSSEEIKAGMEMLTSAAQRLLEHYESLGTNINAMQARLASLIASRR